MSIEFAIIVALVSFGLLIVTLLVIFKMPKMVKKNYFLKQWRDLQGLCGDKSQWADALLKADELFGSALKKRKFAGITMGERMVSAQKVLSNNDSIWAAHKFCNKISDNREMEIKESEVKDALVAFRQALRDLGAL